MLASDLRYAARTLRKNLAFRINRGGDRRARHWRQHGNLQRRERVIYPTRFPGSSRTVTNSRAHRLARREIIGRLDTGPFLATGETAHFATDQARRPARLPERCQAYFSLPPKR